MLCGGRATGFVRMDMSDAATPSKSPAPARVAIIVAMKREIEPLLAKWQRNGKKVEHKSISVLDGYMCEGARVIVAGIGRKNAAVATRVVIEYHEPELIISAGLAGALRAGLAPGAAIRAAVVVDGASGQKYECRHDSGARGVLVTTASVLCRDEKQGLAAKFGGDAVEMEAAAVAEVAHASGIAFMAVKAISDPLHMEMPPMDRFIDAAGKLNLLKLIGYAALRPWTWKALNELRKNSRMAAETLASELEKVIAGAS